MSLCGSIVNSADLCALDWQIFYSFQATLSVIFNKLQVGSLGSARIDDVLVENGVHVVLHLEVCFSQVVVLTLVLRHLHTVVFLILLVKHAVRTAELFDFLLSKGNLLSGPFVDLLLLFYTEVVRLAIMSKTYLDYDCLRNLEWCFQEYLSLPWTHFWCQ